MPWRLPRLALPASSRPRTPFYVTPPAAACKALRRRNRSVAPAAADAGPPRRRRSLPTTIHLTNQAYLDASSRRSTVAIELFRANWAVNPRDSATAAMRVLLRRGRRRPAPRPALMILMQKGDAAGSRGRRAPAIHPTAVTPRLCARSRPPSFGVDHPSSTATHSSTGASRASMLDARRSTGAITPLCINISPSAATGCPRCPHLSKLSPPRPASWRSPDQRRRGRSRRSIRIQTLSLSDPAPRPKAAMRGQQFIDEPVRRPRLLAPAGAAPAPRRAAAEAQHGRPQRLVHSQQIRRHEPQTRADHRRYIIGFRRRAVRQGPDQRQRAQRNEGLFALALRALRFGGVCFCGSQGFWTPKSAIAVCFGDAMRRMRDGRCVCRVDSRAALCNSANECSGGVG